jgi:hypothetical protein
LALLSDSQALSVTEKIASNQPRHSSFSELRALLQTRRETAKKFFYLTLLKTIAPRFEYAILEMKSLQKGAAQN